MTAVEKRGKSSEIKEQYEKHEKFVWGEFFFSPKRKNKGDKKVSRRGAMT